MALQNATGSDVESLSEGLFCIYFAVSFEPVNITPLILVSFNTMSPISLP